MVLILPSTVVIYPVYRISRQIRDLALYQRDIKRRPHEYLPTEA